MNKINIKRMDKSLIMLAATAILIAASGIVFKQTFLRILPLFVSVVISYLTAKVDRRALLLGGLNSILYAVVYFSFKLYASAAYALIVSFTFQIYGYIMWSKKSYKNSTMLKKLSTKQRIIILALFVVCWIMGYKILFNVNSSYIVLDNTITLIGILGSILMVCAYMEYTWAMTLSSVLSVILYIVMSKENPEQITYVIYNIYCTICVVKAVMQSKKLYDTQQAEKRSMEVV